jgi:hypothetical protein
MAQKRIARREELYAGWTQPHSGPVIAASGEDTSADQAAVTLNPFFRRPGSPIAEYPLLAYVRTGDPVYSVISLALSKDGLQWLWWRSDGVTSTGRPEPVLIPEGGAPPEGSDSTNRLNSPHALSHGDKIYLWSSWYNSNTGFKICLAASADGFTFGPNTPVLLPSAPSDGAPEPFDGVSVHAPTVLLDGEKVRMWYIGRSAAEGRPFSLGLAEYESLASTAPQARYGPLFPGPNQTLPQWASGRVGFPRVVRYAGRYQMFFSGQAEVDAWRIGLAESPAGDGLSWEVSSEEPILTPAEGTWNSFSVYSPSIVVTDHTHGWQLPGDLARTFGTRGLVMYFGGSDGSKVQTGIARRDLPLR